MLGKYRRLIEAFYASIWAIEPEKLAMIQEFLEFAAAGGKYSPTEVAARTGARPTGERLRADKIGVIPIYGIISQRVEMLNDISGPGGTSTERVAKAFRSALNDESVKAIILDIDSPGGSVYGVDELST